VPTHSIVRRAMLATAILSIALTGCSAVSATPASAEDPPTTTQPTKPAKPECMKASPSLSAAVNELVVGKGAGNTVANVAVEQEADTGWWVIVGGIDVPPENGDDKLGFWVTELKPSEEPFEGTIWAMDNAAAANSTAALAEEVTIEPVSHPAGGCYYEMR
jgi:uncharacterized protein YceK